MKKTLAIILASVLNIKNTGGIMASDAPEIEGDDNIVSTKASTETLQDRDKINEIFSYLPLKEIGRNRLVSKGWNDWIQQSIKHLIPRATWEDIKDFLKSPELKLPFYYAPKNARRNMNDFFLKPDSWKMMLSLLEKKKHALQDQQLFLEEGLQSTTQRVTPILEMFFNAEHTREEKQVFIQNSLLNPEVITFLGKTPALMDEIKIEPETRKIIKDRFDFLKTLRGMTPEYMYNYVRNQSNIPLKALGFLFIGMNKNVYVPYRTNTAGNLASLGGEYKPQAAQICGSIATDTNVNSRYRIDVANILAGLGEEYKLQAVEIFLSIATDPKLNISDRERSADTLAGLGEEYKPQAAQACLSIAKDTNLYIYNRNNAAQHLAGLGEEYKPQAAQAYGSIAKDTNVYPWRRIQAANILAGWGEEYIDQAAQACFSIATDMNVDSDDRIDTAKTLALCGEEYKPQAAQACLSIAKDTNLDPWKRIDAAKILAGLGEKYKLQAIQICRSIAMTTQEKCIRIEAKQALQEMGSF